MKVETHKWSRRSEKRTHVLKPDEGCRFWIPWSQVTPEEIVLVEEPKIRGDGREQKGV